MAQLYSYLLKERCPFCSGNIECKTESAGEYGGSYVDMRTFMCLMCCREPQPAELVNPFSGQTLAVHRSSQMIDDVFGMWDYIVKVDLCKLRKKK